MSRLPAHLVHTALLAAIVACGDPTGDATPGSSEGDQTTADAPTTDTPTTDTPTTDAPTTDAPTGQPETTDGSTTDTPTTDAPTTDGPTSDTEGSSTSDDGDETTAATTDDGSSTDASTSTGEPASTTGEPVDGFYGDCANHDEAEVCNVDAGESCIAGPGGAAVCGVYDCVDDDDCAPVTSGNAPVVCSDFTNASDSLICHIECMGGETCPDGMACVSGICAWERVAQGGGECPDADLGSAVPQLFAGDNTGLHDDVLTTCGVFGGEEALLQFTAPEDGTYRFETISAADTILMIIDGCGGPVLACNDDGEGLGLLSAIEIALVADESIIVAVDGFDGETAPFELDVTLVP